MSILITYFDVEYVKKLFLMNEPPMWIEISTDDFWYRVKSQYTKGIAYTKKEEFTVGMRIAFSEWNFLGCLFYDIHELLLQR